MTEPLTTADCDLRDFAYMPLDVGRLRDSGIALESTGDEFRAAVLLWCASWHQVPAASLPDNDRALASLAGYGRDTAGWDSVRAGAMRGWVACSDGRYYHPVIAEKAIAAWDAKKAQRLRTENATKARWKADGIRNGDRNGIRDGVQGKGREGRLKGEEKTPPLPPAGGVALPFESDAFKSAWAAWKEHRRRLRKPMTDHAQRLTLAKLPKVEATAITWINTAIERGWQGIFEPKADGGRTPINRSKLVNTWHDPNPDQEMRRAF